MNMVRPAFLSWAVFALFALLPGGIVPNPAPAGGDPSPNLGLATESPQPTDDQWQPALTGYRFSFPRDHALHKSYKLEWWYYTGNLKTSSGREFGFQLTFFRTGVVYKPVNPSRWAIRDLYPAHFAISDVAKNQFHYFERINRAGVGWAGADPDRYRVWNEDWEARLDGSVHVLTARARDFAIELRLSPEKPEAVNDEGGVSQKGNVAGYATHYYSLSRLFATGRIEVDGRPYEVSGLAWMDHEFGSRFLQRDQIGWDWFSIQLDDGRDLMLLQIRRSDGSIDAHATGTLVGADGRPTHLSHSQFSLSPRERWLSAASGANYPVAWHVEVPGEGLRLDVRPAIPDQELRTQDSTGIVYWEGAIRVSGLSENRQVQGSGYLEMTGYADQELPDQLRSRTP
jgi:predicted secreted hydrolase